MKKITSTLLGIGAVVLATAGWALAAGDVVVTYTPDNTLFPNPERGFLYASEAHSWNAQESDYVLLDQSTLQGYRQNENITLIKRTFYLDGFVNSPIPQWYLDKMQVDFNTLRAAGLKAVIRFAYTNRSFVPPYGDADKARVLEHLAQLQPIFQNNVDVIAVVEAGFIGNWGEWFYTDYFVANPSDPASVTPADYENRREVLEGILNVLPASRAVQLRTPFYKYKTYGTPFVGSPAVPVPLDASNAHDGSYIARTGHHNDCFLGNETDAGTYGVWVSVADDKNYLAAETMYVPMGGEVCEPGVGQPRFSCQSAMNEMAQFHWSYLNVETGASSRAIYDAWDTAGCLPEIKRRLGYHLALVQGTYPEKVTSGGAFSIAIQLQNDGWSAPINPRPVNLVLRKQDSGAIYTIPLTGEDPRFWLAGTTQTIAHTLVANVPPGKYDLLLHLPDAEPSLSGPKYAIRLANRRVWEETTGYNSLRYTLTVTQAPTTKVATTTSVVSSKNPSTFRSSVTFTATVKSTTTGTPTGLVTFKDGDATLGTGTLSSGKATFKTSALSAGTHSITAVYGGSSSYSGSTSLALTQKVQR